MPPTHRDLYSSFAAHEVRYLVFGGVATVLHGHCRVTVDLDILIEPTPENARATVTALREAGLGTAYDVEPEQLLAHQITAFEDVLAVDVFTETPGVQFAEAWERRCVRTLDGVPVNMISVDDLIASKEASGRERDLEDVAVLRAIHAKSD